MLQGLSTELGAFVAGVMLSATEQQENALHQLEHLKQFFLSLFICSTGLIMSPTFLAQHLRVLAGGLVVTVLAKTVLVRRSPFVVGGLCVALQHHHSRQGRAQQEGEMIQLDAFS